MINTNQTNTTEQPETSFIEGRSPYLIWLIWVVWLPLSIPAFISLFRSHPPLTQLIASLCGVALFFAVYLFASWRRAVNLVATSKIPKHTDAFTWLMIFALTGLCCILTLLSGSEWVILFYYTSGYVGGSLLIRRAILTIVVITIVAMVVASYVGLGWYDFAQSAIFIPAIVVITRTMMWSITTSWQLIDARKEIARLAVETERLRIARDLHDLLGHNLSLIALKSELAKRLVNVSPERAEIEIGDVETVARSTLQEVREAVSAFRQPTLKSELNAAREMFAAAGIVYRFEGDDYTIDALPTTIEAVLSWTIREGVTNVIRHSHAHHCVIRMTRNTDQIAIEVMDDGIGQSSTDNLGNGLRGLEERVERLGGRCEASPREIGGFCLAVIIPLTQQSHEAMKPAQITPTLTKEASVEPQVDVDKVKEGNELS